MSDATALLADRALPWFSSPFHPNNCAVNIVVMFAGLGIMAYTPAAFAWGLSLKLTATGF